MDNDTIFVILRYACLLFALCVHEAAHAGMANWCGDPSARLLGRFTLNPLKHIDPIGTVVMPLLMMFSGYPFLFGWAKPVPFNPVNLKNIRRDPVLIAIAGPASNLLMALTGAVMFRLFIVLYGAFPDAQWVKILAFTDLQFIMINLLLMLFNAIPVPPLDGHYVLHFFLPESGQRTLERVGPFGIIIAIMVAQPWLSVSMPIMMDIVVTIASWGQADATNELLRGMSGLL